MTTAALLSPRCAHELHDGCNHVVRSSTVNLWPLPRRASRPASLCACGCHASCPLSGDEAVSQEVWLQRCTCPGTIPARQWAARSEERGRELRAVVESIRQEGAVDADELQRRLRAVFEDHGERPPPLTAIGSLFSAGTARRGTRHARLGWLAVRGVARGVRWAWQPAADSEAANRAALRQGYRIAAIGLIVSLLLISGAIRSSSWRRFVLALAAVLIDLLAAWSVMLLTGISSLGRHLDERTSS